MTAGKAPEWPFDRDTVNRAAPESGGVYVLSAPGWWLYVGQSGNVREQLLAHLDDTNHPMWLLPQPTAFAVVFSSEDEAARVERAAALIRELRPLRNASPAWFARLFQ